MKPFAILLALTFPAYAEVCRPPNVPRAVLELGYTSRAPLRCPVEGICYRASDDQTHGTVGAVLIKCLTPDQETDAIELGRLK